jgi:hypothetical protein
MHTAYQVYRSTLYKAHAAYIFHFFQFQVEDFVGGIVNLSISCLAKPKLFTSSILLNDSVVEPARLVVSQLFFSEWF